MQWDRENQTQRKGGQTETQWDIKTVKQKPDIYQKFRA